MKKSELRKKYRALRAQLPEKEFAQLNQQLCDLFFKHVDLSSIRLVHTFLPIAKNKEPNTWLIVERIQRSHPNITLSIPKINVQTGEIDSYYLDVTHPHTINSWGIPEPQQGRLTPIKNIDLVIVPLLTFDESGQRVGYGKGYYDKFLASCKKVTHKIGLSFFPPEKLIEDADTNDIALTACITPERFYYFG